MPDEPRRRRSRGLIGWIPAGSFIALLALSTSCIATPPAPGSIKFQTRIDGFPEADLALRAPAVVHWDARQTPMIVAKADEDVPYIMGLVHAHQRLASMELIKRVAWGRLSEMAGPLTNGIDHSIRALGLTVAVPEMEEALPDETRVWIERYVEGINDYRGRVAERSADFRALGFDQDEAWTVQDVLAIGRLASADINWGRWLGVMNRAGQRGYQDYVARLRRTADDGAASFGPGEPTPLDVIMDRSKAGSNAFAVAGFRSASGAAILAADPHLGLPQPNIWATVAYRSPDSAALGFTIPGLPFVLVGRNEDIAWGGTNMQAAASVLYDVSDDDTRVEPRKERIGTRFWFDKTVEIENHPLGPVVTDALLFRGLPGPSALKWTGHEVSDEATAFLKLSQAEGWSDFTEAFSTFAAGGQNFIYADRSGRIGQILATRFVEAAGNAAWTVPADPDDPRFAWDDGLVGAELPTAIDPEEGYLVSANNTPVKIDPPVVPQGNADDRVLRMQDVLSRTEDATWEDLAELQLDVFSQASLDCAAALLPLAPEGELRSTIAGWDGNYDRESTGPVAYQRVMTELLPIAYRDRYSASLIGTLRGASYSHRWVREDIESGRITGEMVERAFESASKGYRPDRTWGDLHRTTLAHPIGQVPIIGSAYRFGDFASSGTLTTVYKSANGLTSDRHSVSFGANSRFVTDMADLDENHLVILGGQDGFLGSENMLDQIDAWQAGGFFRVPLSEAGMVEAAAATTRLAPSSPENAP